MASNCRRNIMRGCGLDSFGSRQKPVAGVCAHSGEPLGSKKAGKLFWLSNHQLLLKKDSAPQN
jgi:hypothetical protein